MRLAFKIGFLSAIILLVFARVNAQIPKKALEIPVKYITPEEGISLSPEINTRPGSFWQVFSDRHRNLTYETAFGKTIKRSIGFMDVFYAANESESRIQIIKDANYKEGFSASAEDYGWIEKENLLLWDHCLITRAGKINKKGIFVNSIMPTEKDAIRFEIQNINIYYNPELTLDAPSRINMNDILYVYKITDDGVLLGKNYVTDIFHAKEEIFGWVYSKQLTIWDHRIAVEPNWEKEAAWERKQKSIGATFYVDIPRAKRFGEGNKVSDKYVVWSNDTYENRNIGDWQRFPLLYYNKETGIIKAAVFGNIQNTEVELFFPAYSTMKIKGLKYPLYKQVIFMTLRELGDLLSKFDALADTYTSSSQRQRLKEVWMELLQSHLGDDFSRERAENMTFENINEKIFGLPGTSKLLHTRLADITDPSVVSDAKFYEYIHNIKNKRIELDKIYNNKNFDYGFYSYDTQYFWISQDLLP